MKLHLVVATVVLLFSTPLALAADSTAPAARPAPVTAADTALTTDAAPAVNVNEAGLMALMSLRGVGERKAEAIIAFRRKHGPFTTLEQLEAVPGIGPSLLQANRGRIVFR